jgi:hypothetical protein
MDEVFDEMIFGGMRMWGDEEGREKKDERGGVGGIYTPRVWSSSCLGCPSGHPPFLNFPSTTICSMSLTHFL